MTTVFFNITFYQTFKKDFEDLPEEMKDAHKKFSDFASIQKIGIMAYNAVPQQPEQPAPQPQEEGYEEGQEQS